MDNSPLEDLSGLKKALKQFYKKSIVVDSGM